MYISIAWLTALYGGTILLLSLAGCSLFEGDTVTREHFIAEVAVIEAPEPIAVSESLEVRLAGNLGPNLCYQLDHIETERTDFRLDVTVHGEYLNPGGCFPAGSHFDEVIAVEPPFQDHFTVIAHQPDGSTLERTFAVASNTYR